MFSLKTAQSEPHQTKNAEIINLFSSALKSRKVMLIFSRPDKND